MSTWVLILAAGDGRRLEGVARDRDGRPVPKQFCDFGTGRTLLRRTLDRAERLAPIERIVSVVAARHDRWWPAELATLPAENVVVQPANRGTAAGILLPLLHVHERDPHATVIVLPSDHHVEDEDVVQASIQSALIEVAARPDGLVLLGVTPDHADTEYGWIMPAGEAPAATRPVASFVEKPGPLEASRLLESGALWNSFMFVGRAKMLLEMFGDRTPGLLAAMRSELVLPAAARSTMGTRRLWNLYNVLEVRDFSREVLQALPSRLRVLAVPQCGWSDLGTPDRLARVLGAAPGLGAGPRYTAV